MYHVPAGHGCEWVGAGQNAPGAGAFYGVFAAHVVFTARQYASVKNVIDGDAAPACWRWPESGRAPACPLAPSEQRTGRRNGAWRVGKERPRTRQQNSLECAALIFFKMAVTGRGEADDLHKSILQAHHIPMFDPHSNDKCTQPAHSDNNSFDVLDVVLQMNWYQTPAISSVMSKNCHYQFRFTVRMRSNKIIHFFAWNFRQLFGS